MAQGKKYRDALKRFDRERLHTPPEAVELVRSLPKANFDETVELVARLGVDPRKADQIVRGTVGLPAGTGKDVRVAVFAAGEAATAAREAGALGAALSGAGSTVIALADDDAVADSVAKAMAATAARTDLQGRSRVVRPIGNGARVVHSVPRTP